MDKTTGKSLVAIYLAKAFEKTCMHCGQIEELCTCNEFENVFGRKKKMDQEGKIR